MANTTIYATYILSIHVLYDSAVIHLLICSLKRMIFKISLSFELYLLADNDIDQREISCFLRIYWAVYRFSKSIIKYKTAKCIFSTATRIMIYKRPSTMPLINTIPRKSWKKVSPAKDTWEQSGFSAATWPKEGVHWARWYCQWQPREDLKTMIIITRWWWWVM